MRLTTNELYDMLEIQASALKYNQQFKFRSGTTINQFVGRDSSNRLLYKNMLTERIRRLDLRKQPGKTVLDISHLFNQETTEYPF